MTTTSSSPVPLYLYAIVDARPRRTVTLGNGMTRRRPLSVMRAGNAYVVVERAEAVKRPTPQTLVAHDRVVQRIARACSAVLPLRFGTTVKDRTALERLLEPLAGAIDDAFDRVRGCVQYTLRVTGRPAPPKPAKKSAGPGTRWIEKRIAAQRVPEIAVLTEATRDLVREARSERRDHGAAKNNLASVYHLVRREDARAWRAAIARALLVLDRNDVHVTFTGPWPPYAFAELT